MLQVTSPHVTSSHPVPAPLIRFHDFGAMLIGLYVCIKEYDKLVTVIQTGAILQGSVATFQDM